jgi:hypothetical protein
VTVHVTLLKGVRRSGIDEPAGAIHVWMPALAIFERESLTIDLTADRAPLKELLLALRRCLISFSGEDRRGKKGVFWCCWHDMMVATRKMRGTRGASRHGSETCFGKVGCAVYSKAPAADPAISYLQNFIWNAKNYLQRIVCSGASKNGTVFGRHHHDWASWFMPLPIIGKFPVPPR